MKQEKIDELREFFESDREDSEIADMARMRVPGLLNTIENLEGRIKEANDLASNGLALLARMDRNSKEGEDG